MSKIIEDLHMARAQVEQHEMALRNRVEHILLLLMSLIDSEQATEFEHDLWWWYGEDEDRPFRRGDRHGYFDTKNDYIPIYLDEPDMSIPGFDAYDRADLAGTAEKRIPLVYLEMDDEALVMDAWNKIQVQTLSWTDRATTLDDARAAGLRKLSALERKALGL